MAFKMEKKWLQNRIADIEEELEKEGSDQMLENEIEFLQEALLEFD